jgi:uncharacterized repeat protein (TIGR02543 family)
MKQNVWLLFIFALCCVSGCNFENPFFDPLYCTVTFDAYSWEPGTSTATCKPKEHVALPSPNPSRDGYVFGGWYTDKEGRGTQFTEKTTVNTDMRVYARWIKTEDAVTVTFDGDGGKPVPATIIRAKGETVVSLPSPNPSRDNYVFGGWYTEQEGRGTQFTEKTPVSADITVYAKWLPYVHVTFDADGGNPGTSTATCVLGTTAKLPSAPTRDNYVFNGWYTEKEGRGTQFTEKTPVSADITVYAKWLPYLHVTFDADGGNPGTSTRACALGATVKLPSAPTRDGYTFEGWYTEKEGYGKKFTSSTPVNADITVYAKWNLYPNITFDTDGGEPAVISPIIYNPNTSTALPRPTRAGYIFGGWYTKQEGGGRELTAETVVTKDITVYAWWVKEQDVLTVTFDADGGTPAQASLTCVKGETLEKLPANPSKDLHTFRGWYTGKHGSGAQFTASTVVNENITVYAWWTLYPVVTFDADGGLPAISPVTCAPNTTVVLPSPTRDGYVFDGWYTEKKGGGAQFTAASVVTADITVYAKWLMNLTVNGTLELGAGSIRFPNTGGMSLQKGAALTIALSGSNVNWSNATWEIQVDAERVSVMGSGASRIWAVPPNTRNGQYTITVMVWIGSTLYVGNFPILITN